MTQKKRKGASDSLESAQFAAEAAYADSIFRAACGDLSGAVAAIEQALRFKPDYAPGILSMASVEYQRGSRAEGKRLFVTLVSMPEGTEDLYQIIDKAGTFLIQSREYADGLELFRAAAERFPGVAEFHQGIGCCAGQEGLFNEAVAASQQAVQLDPANAAYLSDLGWTLLLAKRYPEAREALIRAVDIDPTNELARQNLRVCEKRMARKGRRRNGAQQGP